MNNLMGCFDSPAFTCKKTLGRISKTGIIGGGAITYLKVKLVQITVELFALPSFVIRSLKGEQRVSVWGGFLDKSEHPASKMIITGSL